jgi:hypothetical protein
MTLMFEVPRLAVDRRWQDGHFLERTTVWFLGPKGKKPGSISDISDAGFQILNQNLT